ncbi:MAG: SoxR reducing system RseC family protein [Clostridia bacterium]|nr:SoxR reducing system RseC family protein [Clostridia bacterium]
MKETGKVIYKENDKIKIRFERSDACEKCGACKIGQNQEGMEIIVQNSVGADIGDIVEVEIEDVKLLRAVLIMYAFPLLMFIIGLFGTVYLFDLLGISNMKEIISFLVGIALMTITYITIKYVDSNRDTKDRYKPKLISIKKSSE